MLTSDCLRIGGSYLLQLPGVLGRSPAPPHALGAGGVLK